MGRKGQVGPDEAGEEGHGQTVQAPQAMSETTVFIATAVTRCGTVFSEDK